MQEQQTRQGKGFFLYKFIQWNMRTTTKQNSNGMQKHSVRVEWFLREKNWALGKLCQILQRPQIQHFSLKYCLLTWPRASENVDCYPKMGKQKCNLTFLKVAPEPKFDP